MSAPALVLVAHGTRSAAGVRMIAAVADAVRAEMGRTGADVPVRTAFVDVLGPTPAEVLGELNGVPAVVVPAFLASGYHVYQDVPREVRDSGHPDVVVSPAMGPDPMLARVMRMRLHEAGMRPGDAVVFAAAGSSDARARHDVRRATAMLADELGVAVRTAAIATGEPRVPDVVAALRESGAERVFVGSYLLAHGLFQQRLHDAGADGVAEPLGAHPAVVCLLVDRYRTAASEFLTTAA
ncbi:sirohydrochlorin chelatase [Nocardia africana]|uniref:Sirohydrochlorin cobaltochelatase n=1 Tax=Nocardia africana TaxID=134964 RepID=A0A378WPE4_9NOCA|nr:sirohydrochlorin chelatase [Nocardia africana]MCC3315396.1 sirohydrochlorin chelatase [Nocardia africana]SUA42294.1 sirohydrochlorin cobaltochelatase [Nocardia africana]